MVLPINRSEDEAKAGDSFFDFYISDRDVTTGYLQDYTKSKELKKLIKEVDAEKQFQQFEPHYEEKNFGYGADWVLIFVEWMAKSDTANALANLGGLIELAHVFYILLEKLRQKFENYGLRIGLKSAKLLALYAIAAQTIGNDGDEYKILFEYEIHREMIAEEKEFIFIIRKKSSVKTITNNFFVHIDWFGNINTVHEI